MAGAGWLGKDGRRYDTLLERSNADKVVEEQEEQTRLLAQQNYLAEKHARKQSQLQEESIRVQQETERERQDHEEKMRMLRLFDDVGINYNLFEGFKDYMFKANPNESEYKKILNIYDKIGVLIDKQNELLATQNEDLDNLKQMDKIGLNNYPKIHEVFASIDVIDMPEEKRQDMKNKIKKRSSVAMSSTLITVACMLVMIIATAVAINNEDLYSTGLIVMLVGMAGTIFFPIYAAIKRGNIYKQIHNELENIRLDLKESVLGDDSRLNESENLNIEIDNLEKDIEKIKARGIQKKWEQFYEFRENNYNSKIEKLLLDTNISQQLGLYDIKFVMLDKSKAKSNGEIDDYIVFFNNI